MSAASILFALALSAPPERVFDKVWATVGEDYYDANYNGADWPAARKMYRAKAAAARDDDELYKTLNEMLRRLNDRHTSAIPPSVVKQERSRSVLRIGFGLQLVEGRWVVKAVDPNSSAYEEGVAPGWLLEKMGGKPMPQRTGEMAAFDESIQYRARCDAGDPIPVALRDPNGAPREVSVTCRKLSITPKHEVKILDGGVVYLRFDEFAPNSHRWMEEVLQANKKAGAAVIDLRENRGGLLDTLHAILPLLFKTKVPFGQITTRSNRQTQRTARAGGVKAFDKPIAVLIDSTTASASEILAAVVQESGCGKIYGSTSAGVVLFSVREDLPGGGELQLSVWDYKTPKGRRLEGAGVVPDVKIEPALADLRHRKDPVLEVALHDLQNRR